MSFEILSDFSKTNAKYRLSRRCISFKLTDIPADVTDTEEWVKSGIRLILSNISTDVDSDDKIGFTFSSANFHKDAYLSFREARKVTFDDVWGLLGRIYQSNSEGFQTDVFRLSVTIVKSFKGMGRVKNYITFKDECKARKGIIYIDNKDNLCLPRALVVGQAYALKAPDMIAIRRNIKKKQDIETEKLLTNSQVTIPKQGAGFSELQKFQSFMTNFKITVYEQGSKGRNVYFEGPNAKHTINLLFHNNHYNVITKLHAAFVCRYYCETCHVPYDHKDYHRCGISCPCCQESPPCLQVKEEIKCNSCNRIFRGPVCFKNHEVLRKGGSLCDTIKRCSECLKTVKTGHQHVCGEVLCKICHCYQPMDHNCYIQPDKRVPRVKDILFIFYDLETMQEQEVTSGEKIHEPNLCVVQQRCDRCIDEEGIRFCEICGSRQKVFHVNIIESFIGYIFSLRRRFKSIVVIAHNGQAFDHQFVLKHLIEKTNLKVDVIMRGTKLVMIKLDNIKFIDSLNYFPMPLSQLPKAFELGAELKKGHFPYLFNTVANRNYKGLLPDVKYYSPDTMKDEARIEFLKWHSEHSNDCFDMQKDLVEYCVSDVDILTKACVKFRKMFLDECNVCPFSEAVTIASACNLVYRRNFLKPETIGLIPRNGYRSVDRQSKIAMMWLISEEQQRHIEIQSALRQREALLAGYRVDGYCSQTNQVFEFHGCFFHGHTCMISNRDKPLYGNPSDTLSRRYERTQIKTAKLRQSGYEVVEIWECEFRKKLQNDKQLAVSLENHDGLHHAPLNPRDAFYGGRTGNVKTYHQICRNERIKYLDVCSLYPWVCKYGKFPVGHPQVFVGQDCEKLNLMEIDGLIKCKILPPTNLFHPVLPSKKNDKLMFVLCNACGDDLNTNDCNHSELERALTGTWVLDEIKKALIKGYKMLNIYEVWKYDIKQHSDSVIDSGLFTAMMNKFVKLKTQASGWPKDCLSVEDKENFLKEFLQKEGILLDEEHMAKNAGLRSLAKLILNSFWGKFGQRENMSKTSIIRNPSELYNLLYNPEINVNHIFEVNDEVVIAGWEHKEETVEALSTVNVSIAAFTTAQARLKLYSYLEKLEERVLYYDTDSVIYVSRKEEYEPPIGDFLGDLTDELEGYGPGSYITTFVSGGPKNYSYIVFSPLYNTYFTVCKVKGINLNFSTSRLIDFYSMANMITSDQSSSISIFTENIGRDKTHQVITRNEKKTYRPRSEKRKFTNKHDSVPYGFKKKKDNTSV